MLCEIGLRVREPGKVFGRVAIICVCLRVVGLSVCSTNAFAQPDRDRLRILFKDDFKRFYDPGGLTMMLVVFV